MCIRDSVEAAHEAGHPQQLLVHRDRGWRGLLRPAGQFTLGQSAELDRGADGAHVHDLILDPVEVAESVQLRDPDVDRGLAALEPGRDGAAGARLLALRPAAGGLALAGGDPAADAGLRGVRTLGGPQIVKLHGVSSAAVSGSSSTSTRKRTARTMPRVASLSGTTTVSPIRFSPSALIVPRFRAMWLIVLLTWVTRSLPAITNPRGRLAGHGRSHGDTAHCADLFSRAKATKGLKRRPRDVHRIGRAKDLGQDVPDACGLDDGADCAAGDDTGTLGGWLQHDLRGTEVMPV